MVPTLPELIDQLSLKQKVEMVTDFIFLDSKTTVNNHCSQEINTFASWKKNYDKPRQHIKKQRHY